MNIRIFATGIAASLALAAPAIAYERTGTTHFHTRFGDVTSVFEASYDPAGGNFSRTGRITTAGGLTLSYALSGTCAAPPKEDCGFAGTGTGPFGGKWRAQGALKREADGLHLVGELTTPDGRTIDFDRQTRGRAPLLEQPAN